MRNNLLPEQGGPSASPESELSFSQVAARLPGLLGVGDNSLFEARLVELQGEEQDTAIKLIHGIADKLEALMHKGAPHIGALAVAETNVPTAAEEVAVEQKPVTPLATEQIIPPEVSLRKICSGEFGRRKIAHTSIWRVLGQISANPKKQPNERGAQAWTITKEEYDRYLVYMDKEYPLVNADVDVPVDVLCNEVGYSWREMVFVAPGKDYARFTERRKPVACVSIETANQIRATIDAMRSKKDPKEASG